MFTCHLEITQHNIQDLINLKLVFLLHNLLSNLKTLDFKMFRPPNTFQVKIFTRLSMECAE